MQTELAYNLSVQMKAPCLIVTDVDNRQSVHELSEGNSVLAGSGETCAIRLSSGEANPLHCMFQLTNGRITAQDWNTGGRTLLNGKPIEEAVCISNQDELRIGTYRISACLKETFEPIAESSQQQETPVQQPEASQQNLTHSPAESEFANEEPFVDSDHEFDSDALTDWNQIDQLENDFPRPDGFSENRVLDSLSNQFVPAANPADDELEILRNEVAYLQVELAERDSQLLQLSEASQFSNQHGGNHADDSQTEKLVARLEQLLAELNGADEKVAVLENLLQVSEEANQAEQEERRQLESWVNQIEQRVLAREAETAAESKKLQSCLQEERVQRSHVETQLKNALELGGQENVADQAARNIIEDLRRQNAELKKRLFESQRQLEMRTEASQPASAATDPKEMLEMKQRIHALESELAGERAEIARKREQLTRFQQEMEQRLSEVKQTAENNCRVAAMKQHLRELHQEEKLERKERFERSLGGRIAMLWQKLDGR